MSPSLRPIWLLCTLTACIAAGCRSDYGVEGKPSTGDGDPTEETGTPGGGDSEAPPPDTGDPPVDADGDGVPAGEDCDDNDGSVYPGAEEVCNDRDDDCDGELDEGVTTQWWADADGDGHGDPDAPDEGCDPPADSSLVPDDCDDGEAAVHPGAEEVCNGIDDDCDGDIDQADTLCGRRLLLSSPGTAEVWFTALSDTDIDISEGGTVVASWSVPAGGVAGPWNTGTGDFVLDGTGPFVAHATNTARSGDHVGSGRGSTGGGLDAVVHAWAGEWLTVVNPSTADVAYTVDTWDGAAWQPTGGGTASAEGVAYASVGWGMHRVQAVTPVSVQGSWMGNIYNNFEYLIGTSGSRVDTRYIWGLPEKQGVTGLTTICVDASGCLVDATEDGLAVGSWTLVQGETANLPVSAQTTYTIDSVGSVQVRLESTPNGYDSSDGTCMDADLVPGKSGVAHDTEFIVAGALGSASGYPSRKTDVTLLAYSDSTTVTVDLWDGSGWVTDQTLLLDADTFHALAIDQAPGTNLRVVADAPIEVFQSHATAEFAWSAVAAHVVR